ncbi:DNA repair protein REV1-like isoform X2 [Tachypleus tridentatus]|uniref:DNA repair protein REV1-like isoform X2 n=1 Tax=Tachypleus tridentatus TaxID=6853 RepID=UPI003FD4A987
MDTQFNLDPTADELKRLMIMHGGTFHHYYKRHQTTHIIATNLPDSKIRELKQEKVVKPEWITESIKAGLLLPDTLFLLYSCLSKGQKKLNSFVGPNKTIRAQENIANPWTEGQIRDKTITMNNDNKDQEIRNSDATGDHDKVLNGVNKHEIQKKNNDNFKSKDKFVKSTGEARKSNMNSSLQSRTAFKDSVSDCFSLLNDSTGPYKTTVNSSLRAGEPNFLSEFYSHSRLHHISTAGAEFKQYVADLRRKNSDNFPGRMKLVEWKESQQGGCPTLNPEITGLENIKSTQNISGEKRERTIMHIDMDCFFVSVGLCSRPDLVGKPVAVTHCSRGQPKPRIGVNVEYERSYYRNKLFQGRRQKSKASVQNTNRVTETLNFDEESMSAEECGSMSEVASCSYEARKAGIKNGMFLGEALKLCPSLQTIPYDFEGYTSVSCTLYDMVASYTLDIEAVSCDELFADCTDVLQETGVSPVEFATFLRREIKEKTGCIASAGFASNILLARLATKQAKPNGQFHLEPDKVNTFMKNQMVKDLPGVGPATETRLETLGITLCGQLQTLSLQLLQKEFGQKTGQSLFDHCRGLDHRVIKSKKERKSVSAEVNYGIRFEKFSEAVEFIKELSMEVHQRLQKVGMKGRSITLKLKIRKKDAPVETAKFMGHGVCDNVAKSLLLHTATDNPEIISRECTSLLQMMKRSPEDLRGVGIQVGRLEPSCAVSATKSHSLLDFISHQTNVLPNSRSETNNTDDLVCEVNQNTSVSTQEDLILPSPSQLDLSVLAALPKDLQEQIQRAYHLSNVGSKNLPGASCSKVEFMQPTEENISPKSEVNSNTMNKMNCLNLGEICRTEISADAKQEPNQSVQSHEKIIYSKIEGYKQDVEDKTSSELKRKKLLQEKSSSSATNCIVPEDGFTSMSQEVKELEKQVSVFGTVCITEEVSNTKVGVTMQNREELEAVPEVFDRSVFEALPVELRSEVMEAYMNEKLNNGLCNPKNMEDDFKKDTRTYRSLFRPDRINSPKKKQGKRGRPLKVNQYKQTTRRTEAVVEGVLQKKVHPDERIQEVISENVSTLQWTPASICGQTQIEDVKSLMKEWIESTPEPEVKDMEVFGDYLLDVVEERDLEKLDLLIKYFHRLVKRIQNHSWEDVYMSVVNKMQSKVVQMYGCALQIDVF